MSEETNKPAQTFKAGLITATIWKNEAKESEKSFYTTTIVRSYKKEGEGWKETNSFNLDDLPKVNL